MQFMPCFTFVMQFMNPLKFRALLNTLLLVIGLASVRLRLRDHPPCFKRKQDWRLVTDARRSVLFLKTFNEQHVRSTTYTYILHILLH